MVSENISILNKERLKLYADINFPSSNNPKAIIFIVHGFGEHSGRYDHVVRFFVDHGYSVVRFDHRGHGQSEGKRGHFRKFDYLLEDLEEVMKHVRLRYMDTPFCIYGHSFGGCLTAYYILKRKSKEAKAAILSSPWLRLVSPPSRSKLTLAKFMSGIFPSYTESTNIEPDVLSGDPEIVSQYDTDPLIHSYISARAFIETDKAGKWILNHGQDLNLSVLLIHGDNDQLTDIEASKEFYSIHKDQVEFHVLENTKHEPHNDLNKHHLLAMISGWLVNQL
ncbi:MAG TPA: alpha/beta hydrolase [Cyclobacteriaceae bacterium]